LTKDQLDLDFVHPAHSLKYNIAENIGNFPWHCNPHLAHIRNVINSRENTNNKLYIPLQINAANSNVSQSAIIIETLARIEGEVLLNGNKNLNRGIIELNKNFEIVGNVYCFDRVELEGFKFNNE
jgi:hypothetical protein